MNDLQKTEQPSNIVPISDNGALMTAIAQAARDPNVDVEKMERLFAMHERMEAKQAEVAFNVAMNDAQSHMGRVATDKTNKQTSSDYATYGALDKALRPIYVEAGFSLSFDTQESPQESYVRVVCHVSHKGGHTRKYTADMPADGKGAKGGDVMTKTHAAGSAMSYGMRYLLKMIFNVAIGEDDDDGNAASMDPKDAAWIVVANGLDDIEKYQEMKGKLLEAYGGKASNLPLAVRDAFNAAKAACEPKD